MILLRENRRVGGTTGLSLDRSTVGKENLRPEYLKRKRIKDNLRPEYLKRKRIKEEGICYSCHVVTARRDAPLRKSALFLCSISKN